RVEPVYAQPLRGRRQARAEPIVGQVDARHQDRSALVGQPVDDVPAVQVVPTGISIGARAEFLRIRTVGIDGQQPSGGYEPDAGVFYDPIDAADEPVIGGPVTTTQPPRLAVDAEGRLRH